MAAAALSLACPLRRSSRLAHAHAHTHTRPSPPPRQHLKHHHPHRRPRTQPDPEPDPDSSSSDPENELTPRALRALKRQRLALDLDGLPLAARVRPRKRRKENIDHATDDPRHLQVPSKGSAEHTKRPSSPSTPLAPKRTHSADNSASADNAAQISTPSISIPEAVMSEAGPSILISPTEDRPSSATYSEPSLCAAFHDEPSVLSSRDEPTSTAESTESIKVPIPTSSVALDATTTSPPLSPVRPLSRASSPDQEPLTPLTPLTSSCESSPSLPGHDRHMSPALPSPPPNPAAHHVHCDSSPSSVASDVSFTPPVPREPLILEPTPTPASPPSPLSLDPALDTLIPFETLPSQFDTGMSLHLDPPPSVHTPSAAQLPQPVQEHFPPLQQTHLPYVAPSPVLNRDREVNIWKLACQERVDCLLRRYGTEYIKALVASEASSVFARTKTAWASPFSSSGSPLRDEDSDMAFSASLAHSPSPTRFRLYTPASYTYTLGSWGSSSPAGSLKKACNSDGECEDPEVDWGMDDGEWGDGDVDMEDDDDDDYDDDEDLGDGPGEGEGNGNVAGASKERPSDDVKMDTDNEANGGDVKMGTDQADEKENRVDSVMKRPSSPNLDATTPTGFSIPDVPSSSAVSPSPPPVTPSRNTYTPPIPLTPSHRPSLPSLSSLHVPLLSEPPRAFMGRGTPPDRRRLVEWSACGRSGTNVLGMGPPLYLSPVPQRHPNNHVETHTGMVPVSDTSIHTPGHQQGEWTSFLYAMLEGDGVNVGVGGHNPEASWYELGLGSVPVPVPAPSPASELSLPLSHSSPQIDMSISGELVAEEGSSSTLRFALG